MPETARCRSAERGHGGGDKEGYVRGLNAGNNTGRGGDRSPRPALLHLDRQESERHDFRGFGIFWSDEDAAAMRIRLRAKMKSIYQAGMFTAENGVR